MLLKLFKNKCGVLAVILVFYLVIVAGCSPSENVNVDVQSSTGQKQVGQTSSNVEDGQTGKENEVPQDNIQSTAEEEQPETSGNQQDSSNNSVSSPIQGELTVHFLDVSQADFIRIELPTGKNILIDAGNNDDSSFIVS